MLLILILSVYVNGYTFVMCSSTCCKRDNYFISIVSGLRQSYTSHGERSHCIAITLSGSRGRIARPANGYGCSCVFLAVDCKLERFTFVHCEAVPGNVIIPKKEKPGKICALHHGCYLSYQVIHCCPLFPCRIRLYMPVSV